MIQILALLIILSTSVVSIVMTENYQKSPNTNQIASSSKVITVISLADNSSLQVPLDILKMSILLKSFFKDRKTFHQTSYEVSIPNITHQTLSIIIKLLTLINQEEEKQLRATLHKRKSIKRPDGLYVLRTVYDIVNSQIQDMSAIDLISLLHAVFFLDIVGSTENQQMLTEVIARHVVYQYIKENNIDLTQIDIPINFSCEKNSKKFDLLFNQLPSDLHPLIKEYITLETIGADGKFDIADYLTLYDPNEDMLFLNTDYSGLLCLRNKKITSLDGIKLLPLKIIALDLSNNFLTCIKKMILKNVRP